MQPLIWPVLFLWCTAIPVTLPTSVTLVVMYAESDEKPLGSRAPKFIKASRGLHLSWQILIFVLGLAVVAGGVVLLPLPGPGWLVIFAGIGVWATEFRWAQRVLRWTKRQVLEWAQWWKRRRREREARKQRVGRR
jgi:uncharacterized protein (TIGR02611 family)